MNTSLNLHLSYVKIIPLRKILTCNILITSSVHLIIPLSFYTSVMFLLLKTIKIIDNTKSPPKITCAIIIQEKKNYLITDYSELT